LFLIYEWVVLTLIIILHLVVGLLIIVEIMIVCIDCHLIIHYIELTLWLMNITNLM